MSTVDRKKLLAKAKKVKDLDQLADEWGHKWSSEGLKREEKREELSRLLGKQTNEEDVQGRLFETPATGQRQSNPPLSGEVCLPLSRDEFLFMWEGGFLCHPAILVAMLRETASEIADSRYQGHPILDWEQLRQVPLDVRVFLNDESDSLTKDWRMPFSSVNRVEVAAEEVHELQLKLRQTHQGFKDEFAIVASSSSLSGMEWPVKKEWDIQGSPEFAHAKKIDSTMGAIAVAGYVERVLLVQQKFQVTVDEVGWLGAAVLNYPAWSVREGNKSAGGDMAEAFYELVKYVRDDVGLGQGVTPDVRNRLSEWSNGVDDFPGLWVEVSSSMPDEVSNAIATGMRRGLLKDVLHVHREVLSPWMKYVLLLWKHKGVRNRSSNARQSLLHSLFAFVNEELIKGDEAVLIAGYHGWHIGYMLCVSPPDSGHIEKYGGPEHWWKLRWPSDTLFKVSKRLLDSSIQEAPKHEERSIALKYPQVLNYNGNGMVFLGDFDVNALRQIADGDEKNCTRAIQFLRRFREMLRSINEMDNPSEDIGYEKADWSKEVRAIQDELLQNDSNGVGRDLLKGVTRWWNYSRKRPHD